jgi:hypothetical protein
MRTVATKTVLLALSLLFAAAGASAQPESLFKVVYSNPQLVPGLWMLEFHPDGTGHFRTERGAASSGEGIEAANIDRDVQLSGQFARHVFDVAEHKRLFTGGCDGHLKVAFQGIKRFSYTGPAGQGSCEFNYSKDPDIQSLSDALLSVANTLLEGARLQALLTYDKLGLDRETEILAESAAEGRAQQIGSIRDILERLADDPAVMERVKRRARALLARASD